MSKHKSYFIENSDLWEHVFLIIWSLGFFGNLWGVYNLIRSLPFPNLILSSCMSYLWVFHVKFLSHQITFVTGPYTSTFSIPYFFICLSKVIETLKSIQWIGNTWSQSSRYFILPTLPIFLLCKFTDHLSSIDYLRLKKKIYIDGDWLHRSNTSNNLLVRWVTLLLIPFVFC